MTERKRAVGIFNNPQDTEAALKELDRSRFSLDRVFVIARNQDKENNLVDTEFCESLRDRFKARISSIAQQDHSTVEGEIVISLTKALTQFDIPSDTARSYNDLVADGRYLVMVEGETADIKQAETLLKQSGIKEWTIYKIDTRHPEVIIVDRRNIA